MSGTRSGSLSASAPASMSGRVVDRWYWKCRASAAFSDIHMAVHLAPAAGRWAVSPIWRSISAMAALSPATALFSGSCGARGTPSSSRECGVHRPAQAELLQALACRAPASFERGAVLREIPGRLLRLFWERRLTYRSSRCGELAQTGGVRQLTPGRPVYGYADSEGYRNGSGAHPWNLARHDEGYDIPRTAHSTAATPRTPANRTEMITAPGV